MDTTKRSFLVGTVAILCVLSLLGSAFAAGLADSNLDLVRKQVPRVEKNRNTLDDDFTELRYWKTTDMGATWTAMQQAGDLGTFSPTTSSLPDFSAIVNGSNELCYVVTLGDAATPGIYSLTGPNFTPVLIQATGNISWATGFTGRGHTDIGKLPNGDLIALFWGLDNGTTNTFWAAKSTNGGTSWGTPWVIATEPTLPPGSGSSADVDLYPHIADMNSATHFFVVYQVTGESGYDQYVLRCPVGGGAGTVTNLNAYSGTYVSYYGGNCKPIAYDPTANALYVCFRNSDLSGTAVYYSNDMGATFNPQSVSGAQRYPNMALNIGGAAPWVISNGGVPGAPGQHCAWYSYDEFGYGGNAWTDRNEFTCIPFDGGDYWLFYMNQAYWFDANHAAVSLNQWGDFTPDGIRVTYTTDGGTTWAPNWSVYHYVDDQIDAGTVNNCEIVGGSAGTAYIISCGMVGITDIEEPTVANQTVDPSTPANGPGPWVISAYLDDNIQVDGPDWVRIEYMYNPIDEGTYYGLWGGEGGGADSCHGCDTNDRLAGTYFFTLPASHPDGYTWVNGDTVWFYIHATDPPGNSGYGPEQAIVVGSGYLGVDNPTGPVTANDFQIVGNYPNPFNPQTYIQFTVPTDMQVTMKVYNTLGQEVASLMNNRMVARGLHRIAFDGSDLASGVYICTMEGGSFFASQKMVLLK